MTTTIVPSIGAAPAFTQAGTGASPGYAAIDFRRLGLVGLQEGVYAAGSFEVTQRGAGANMSVDLAASTHTSGVAALVEGDAVAGQGLYAIAPHNAVINETVTAAHATLPRIDQVVLELKDTTHDASGSNLVQTRVVAGTATSGATLDNRTGVASLPPSSLLLADVLVGAAVSTLPNSVIRDRRKWARGAYVRIVRNANAAAGNDYTITGSTLALIDGTNLAPRIECSGVPVRMTLTGGVLATTTNSASFAPQIDSVGVDGMQNVGAASVGTSNLVVQSALNNAPFLPGLAYTFVPSAGSHILSIAWGSYSAGTVTLLAKSGQPVVFTIEEILRQNTKNNATTTG